MLSVHPPLQDLICVTMSYFWSCLLVCGRKDLLRFLLSSRARWGALLQRFPAEWLIFVDICIYSLQKVTIEAAGPRLSMNNPRRPHSPPRPVGVESRGQPMFNEMCPSVSVQQPGVVGGGCHDARPPGCCSLPPHLLCLAARHATPEHQDHRIQGQWSADSQSWSGACVPGISVTRDACGTVSRICLATFDPCCL